MRATIQGFALWVINQPSDKRLSLPVLGYEHYCTERGAPAWSTKSFWCSAKQEGYFHMMSWEGELKARPYTISDAVSKAAAKDWEMNAEDLVKFLRREGFDLYHFACIPSPWKPADALCFSRVPYGGSFRHALDGQSVTFYRSETHEQIAMLKKQGEQWVVARTDHYLTLPELMAISDVGSAIALSKALGYEHITKR